MDILGAKSSVSRINATHFDRIPAFPRKGKPKDHIVNAIIETPKGSCQKYALSPDYGVIAFHHVLPHGLEWPYDYGFIPQTIAPDTDPLDVLLINENGLFSGCLIEARIIGAIRECKEDIENDRLIGVPLPSPGAPMPTDNYHDIKDIPKQTLDEIQKFLVEYPRGEGEEVRIRSVVGIAGAMKSIKRYRKVYEKRHK